MDITTEALDCLLAGRMADVAVARDWELLRERVLPKTGRRLAWLGRTRSFSSGGARPLRISN
jgi:hypothetical protein